MCNGLVTICYISAVFHARKRRSLLSKARVRVEDVLLIDDDVELCSMLTEYLGKNGFRVKTAHRGDLGLRGCAAAAVGADPAGRNASGHGRL